MDESLLGLTPAQRARRVQDDAGHWPARAGATRPPYIHPEQWQTLSATVRRELAREHQESLRAKTIGTQTGAVAVLEICTGADSTLGQIVSEAKDTVCRYTAALDFRLKETLDAGPRDVARLPGALSRTHCARCRRTGHCVSRVSRFT